MDLKSLLKHTDNCTYQECKRRRWPCDDDIRQDIRLEVWLKSCSRELSKRLIRTIVRRQVVNFIRKTIGRKGHYPRSIHLTSREWRKLSVSSSVSAPEALRQELDQIETCLDGDDLIVFRMVRQGYGVEAIATILGVSRNTAWKKRTSMYSKCRSVMK